MKTSGQNFHLHRNFMYSTVKEYIVHKQKKMMKKISNLVRQWTSFRNLSVKIPSRFNSCLILYIKFDVDFAKVLQKKNGMIFWWGEWWKL